MTSGTSARRRGARTLLLRLRFLAALLGRLLRLGGLLGDLLGGLLALLATDGALGARDVPLRVEEVQVPLGAGEVAARHLLRLAGGRRAARALHRRLPHVAA